METALLAALAYLSGSFPSGVVLGLLLAGRDPRGYGSGNIGAANVARLAGFRGGALVGALDILKGILPVLFARGLGLDAHGLALVALAAVLGHDFSLFLRFQGGKGVATTLGVSLVLAPVPTLLGAATWLLLLATSGIASLASLVALALLPVYLGLLGQPPIYVLLGFALFVLAAAKHWPNILRLLQGTEPGLRRPARGD